MFFIFKLKIWEQIQTLILEGLECKVLRTFTYWVDGYTVSLCIKFIGELLSHASQLSKILLKRIQINVILDFFPSKEGINVNGVMLCSSLCLNNLKCYCISCSNACWSWTQSYFSEEVQLIVREAQSQFVTCLFYSQSTTFFSRNKNLLSITLE